MCVCVCAALCMVYACVHVCKHYVLTDCVCVCVCAYCTYMYAHTLLQVLEVLSSNPHVAIKLINNR